MFRRKAMRAKHASRLRWKLHRIDRLNRTADHGSDQTLMVHLSTRHSVNCRTVLQNHNAVGDFEDLIKPV